MIIGNRCCLKQGEFNSPLRKPLNDIVKIDGVKNIASYVFNTPHRVIPQATIYNKLYFSEVKKNPRHFCIRDSFFNSATF